MFRNLSDVDRIFGLYGYFDHKQTGFDNGFNQITFGAELLGEKWDLRANSYIPITGVQNVGLAPGNGNLAFVNDQLFINSQTVQESAYHGVDFEVGRLLTVFGENDNELRLYGGGFFFDSKESGYEQIAGPRARLEMRLFDVDLLGEGARFTFSGEVQYDDVRQTRGFAGIGVQIPLGRLSREGVHSPGVLLHYRSMSRMERRMLDPVIRDVDIVTNTKLEGEAEELVNDAEGDPLFLADANYDIGNAIAKAGTNGTVVVSGSIDTTGSNQLIDGQRITSVTTVQTVTGSLSGTKITSSLPGTQGVINGTDSTQAFYCSPIT